jgi:hypothetical protein
MAELRRVTDLTGDAWQKVVAEPALASPITRLLGWGVTQNAIWDLMKVVGGVVAIGLAT